MASKLTEEQREDLHAARAIAKEFKFTLPRRWKGQRWVWHPWHSGHLTWQLDYDMFISRIIAIYRIKPKRQLEHRFRILRVVKGDMPRSNRRFAHTFSTNMYLRVLALHNKECKDCGYEHDTHHIPTLN